MRRRSTSTTSGALIGLLAALATGACATNGGVEDGYPLAGARARLAAQAGSAESAPQRSFAELLQEGDQLREQGDAGRAVYHYLQALGLQPEASEPRERIAYLHLASDPARAQPIFEDLASRAGKAASPHVGLGLAHLAQGQIHRARRELERAIELGSSEAVPAAALGLIYDRLGEHGVAQGFHHRALASRPSDPDLLNNLGTSELLAGSFAAAEKTLREATRRRPGDTAIRNNLALALGRLEQYDAALAIFRETGDPAAVENNLGYLYFLNGAHQRAIEHFERALLLGHPDRLTVLRNLDAAQRARFGRQAVASKPKPKRVEKPSEPAPESHGQSIDPSMWGNAWNR